MKIFVVRRSYSDDCTYHDYDNIKYFTTHEKAKNFLNSYSKKKDFFGAKPNSKDLSIEEIEVD